MRLFTFGLNLSRTSFDESVPKYPSAVAMRMQTISAIHAHKSLVYKSLQRPHSFQGDTVSKMPPQMVQSHRLKKGGLAMNHFALKFWLLCAFAAIIWLLFS